MYHLLYGQYEEKNVREKWNPFFRKKEKEKRSGAVSGEEGKPLLAFFFFLGKNRVVEKGKGKRTMGDQKKKGRMADELYHKEEDRLILAIRCLVADALEERLLDES